MQLVVRQGRDVKRIFSLQLRWYRVTNALTWKWIPCVGFFIFWNNRKEENFMTTKGYFGQFGGSFVPEPIQVLLDELEVTFENTRMIQSF